MNDNEMSTLDKITNGPVPAYHWARLAGFMTFFAVVVLLLVIYT